VATVHKIETVCSGPTPAGFQWRKLDDDHPDIAVALKSEGSKVNLGYCFGCNHPMIPLGHQPRNPAGFFAQHVCKVSKPREKKVSVAVAGGSSGEVRRVEKGVGAILMALQKTYPVLKDHMAYDDDLRVESDKVIQNVVRALQERSASSELHDWKTVCWDLAKDRRLTSLRDELRHEESELAVAEEEGEDDIIPIDYKGIVLARLALNATSEARIIKLNEQVREWRARANASEEHLAQREKYYEETFQRQNECIASLRKELALQREAAEKLLPETVSAETVAADV
jgi:hypothetical protein